ncbi:hypothetical protein K788_0002585 [Paraburkholderia caribensis MBA4]|uniref:Uncharacterized protein n=1 Tax=Paraburkholderia caribensis MBA4 TaxID=1323664 RepID=A0A0N7JTK4_9BURK|nr:hypothetical protein K788_0002585 [Paraburkholderia caribensis MBA4]
MSGARVLRTRSWRNILKDSRTVRKHFRSACAVPCFARGHFQRRLHRGPNAPLAQPATQFQRHWKYLPCHSTAASPRFPVCPACPCVSRSPAATPR